MKHTTTDFSTMHSKRLGTIVTRYPTRKLAICPVCGDRAAFLPECVNKDGVWVPASYLHKVTTSDMGDNFVFTSFDREHVVRGAFLTLHNQARLRSKAYCQSSRARKWLWQLKESGRDFIDSDWPATWGIE